MTSKHDCGLELDLGNLAWAPVNDFDAVELLDQFNGVPTMAIVETASEGNHLVWQVISASDFSVWLYVPLTARLRKLVERKAELNGVIFEVPTKRFATVGFAFKNRLFFERECQLQPRLSAEKTAASLLDYALTTLNIAAKNDLPASRKELIRKAREELRLVAA